MLETALMYFFAIVLVHYRAINAVKERESANTKKALEMTEQWAERVETERCRRLYTTVLHDWTCHLGNQMSRKRKNETDSVPKTKKTKGAKPAVQQHCGALCLQDSLQPVETNIAMPAMFSPQADTTDILKMSASMARIGRPSSSPSSSPTPLSTGCNYAAGLPDNTSEEDMEQCPPPSPPLLPFPDQDCASVPDIPFSPPAPEFWHYWRALKVSRCQTVTNQCVVPVRNCVI